MPASRLAVLALFLSPASVFAAEPPRGGDVAESGHSSAEEPRHEKFAEFDPVELLAELEREHEWLRRTQRLQDSVWQLDQEEIREMLARSADSNR